MAQLEAARNSNQKAIVGTISSIGDGKYRRFQVFSDWLEMLSISLSNVADKSQFDARENRYLEISKKYSEEEMSKFSTLLSYLVDEFSGSCGGIFFRDVLGEIFMLCEFGNDYTGQYFTPYHVSSLMAKMAIGDDASEVIKKRGFFMASEPTCGAGGMCIALAQSIHEQGFNYQQCLHITAQDIDPVCVHMTYIQLSLLHVPAIVILGDTLKKEQYQHWFTLAHAMGLWDKKLQIAKLID